MTDPFKDPTHWHVTATRPTPEDNCVYTDLHNTQTGQNLYSLKASYVTWTLGGQLIRLRRPLDTGVHWRTSRVTLSTQTTRHQP